MSKELTHLYRRVIGVRADVKVKAEDWERWPFTVDEGVLTCDPREGYAVTFRANGKTYAVNGSARARADQLGLRLNLDEIQRRDDQWGTIIPVAPLVAFIIRCVAAPKRRQRA